LGSTLTAEPLSVFINRSTQRTSRWECPAALPAEAPTFAVLVAAGRAVHRLLLQPGLAEAVEVAFDEPGIRS
jgi:hypothetical protein